MHRLLAIFLWTIFLFSAISPAFASNKSKDGKCFPIDDGAKYLTPSFIPAIKTELDGIANDLGVDVCLKTVETVPFPTGSLNDPQQLFLRQEVQNWIHSQLPEGESRALHLLLIRNPPNIVIGVGSALALMGDVTENDKTVTMNEMTRYFNRKQFDQGTLVGVRMLRMALYRNMRIRYGSILETGLTEIGEVEAPASPTRKWLVLGGIVSALATLLFFLFRKLSAKEQLSATWEDAKV